ncbi:hypothetical protein HYPSUDRAFT_1033070 [Hypholoma sublateritium FD-334 SS-4]|uniref:Uncharacterized protein n=1 Tax=Hypholoma sublateritium (strain FD-334 SS-4) TaxID=945553 RepID=A0A0D2P7B5_HYPSF|nr:hypothetical protein HYPSUDRAFT_1033070 [Hypholoma sublateritium FD-334 SS-4]
MGQRSHGRPANHLRNRRVATRITLQPTGHSRWVWTMITEEPGRLVRRRLALRTGGRGCSLADAGAYCGAKLWGRLRCASCLRLLICAFFGLQTSYWTLMT